MKAGSIILDLISRYVEFILTLVSLTHKELVVNILMVFNDLMILVNDSDCVNPKLAIAPNRARFVWTESK